MNNNDKKFCDGGRCNKEMKAKIANAAKKAANNYSQKHAQKPKGTQNGR
jgi:hypothetical protein